MLLPQPPSPPVLPSHFLEHSSSRWSDRLATWAWSLIFVLLPWVMVPWFGERFELPQQTVGFFLVASCFLLEMWRWWQTPRRRTWSIWLIICLVPLATLISALLSVDQYGSLFGVSGQIAASAFTMGMGALLAAAALLRANDTWATDALPWWVWSIGLLVTVQIVHPLGNNLSKALLGVGTVLFALGHLWHDPQKGWFGQRGGRGLFAWTGFVFAILATALLLWGLDEPALWCILLVGFILLAGLGWRAWLERPRSPALFLSGLLAALAIAGLILPLPALPFVAKNARLSPVVTWQVAKTAAAQQPFFGAGAGGWTVIFDRIRPAEFNVGALTTASFDFGYSTFSTNMATGGLFGALAWLALLLTCAVFALRNWWQDQENTSLGWFASWGALVAAACVLTWPVSLTIWFWAISGVLLSNALDYEDIRLSIWSRRLLMGGIGLLLVTMLGLTNVLARRVLAEAALAQATHAQDLGQDGRVYNLLERAQQLNPWQRSYLDVDVSARVQRFQKTPASEDIAPLIERARRETQQWPFAAESWVSLAGAYQTVMDKVDGADVFAIRAWQEAAARRPSDPLYPRQLAEVFIRQAQKTAALRSSTDAKVKQGAEKTMREQYHLAQQWLERAQELQPSNPEIVYSLAVVAAKQGDLASSIQLMQSLVQQMPSDNTLALELAVLLHAASRPTEAITTLQTILLRDQKNLRARVFLSDVLEEQKRYKEAITLLTQLSLQDQADPAVQERLKRLRSASANVRMVPNPSHP